MLTRQRAMERNICACLRDKWLGRINMQKSTFLVHFSQRGWGNEKCSNCENCIDLFFTWKSFDRATSSFEEKILSGPRLTVVGCGRQPGICLRHWQCSGPEYLGTIAVRRSARDNISHQLGKMAPTTLHRTKQHKQSWARDAGAGVGGWRTMNRTLGLIWRDYRSQGVSTYLHIYTLRIYTRAWKRSIRMFVISEKAPTRAFSWLKAPTTFTFKTLLIHYAKRAFWLHGK